MWWALSFLPKMKIRDNVMNPNGDELRNWIESEISQHENIHFDSPLSIQLLKGDAGFRQYYRLNTHPSLLAVSAPHTEGHSESAKYFADMSSKLIQQGVPAPQVIAMDEEKNFLLLEDFGCESMLDKLNDDSVDLLYGEVLMLLLRMQQIPQSEFNLPKYDETVLHEEMQLFKDWFVEKLLDYQLSSNEHELIDQLFAFLIEQAQQQPKVFVHRDYHSRNLMYREGESPGVIDYQDALWGPITYDLVSLLRDCYISWPEEKVNRWLMSYGNMAIDTGLMPLVSEAQWQKWFDTMGLQRHIKVLGIFARLNLRDEKSSYLNDLPLVWHYVMSIAQKYKEAQAFYHWSHTTLLPLVKQQSWYQGNLNPEQNAVSSC
jgi:aminoglycoside/choline kinase family phosphotransferase